MPDENSQPKIDVAKQEPSEYGWLDYMHNALFTSNAADTNANDEETTETDEDQAILNDSASTRRSSYEEQDTDDDGDAYLLQQALAAARAIHHIHGVEYDENIDINVVSDIKFLVITVSLPLGLLFQEHNIGVWVSRVVHEGSGALNGVETGDQLAAIDGRSTLHAQIDEVADAIANSPDSSNIELTFLRYIGPLRPVPGEVVQEGFEVTDRPVSKHISSEEPKRRGRLPGSTYPRSTMIMRNLGPFRKGKLQEEQPGKSASASPKRDETRKVRIVSTQDQNTDLMQSAQQESPAPKASKKFKGLGKMLKFKKKKV